MIFPDEAKVMEIVKEYSLNKHAADLSKTNGQYSEIMLDGVKTLTIVDSNLSDVLTSSPKVNAMPDVSFEAFVDLCEETDESYDFIVLHSNMLQGIDIQNVQKDLIRRVQSRILNDAGMLILVIRDKNFVLDDYLKPGADKLTKKVVPEELKDERPFQAWAFYN